MWGAKCAHCCVVLQFLAYWQVFRLAFASAAMELQGRFCYVQDSCSHQLGSASGRSLILVCMQAVLVCIGLRACLCAHGAGTIAWRATLGLRNLEAHPRPACACSLQLAACNCARSGLALACMLCGFVTVRAMILLALSSRLPSKLFEWFVCSDSFRPLSHVIILSHTRFLCSPPDPPAIQMCAPSLSLSLSLFLGTPLSRSLSFAPCAFYGALSPHTLGGCLLFGASKALPHGFVWAGGTTTAFQHGPDM